MPLTNEELLLNVPAVLYKHHKDNGGQKMSMPEFRRLYATTYSQEDLSLNILRWDLNTPKPDPSSLKSKYSTTDYIAENHNEELERQAPIPTITSAEREVVVAKQGNLIYDIDEKRLYIYHSSKWNKL